MSDVTIGEGESITPNTEYVNISGIPHRLSRNMGIDFIYSNF